MMNRNTKQIIRQKEIFASRIILTQQQAIEIYMKNPTKHHLSVPHQKYKSQSRLISEHYGVSPKAVRDIWNGKYWVFATRHLDSKFDSDYSVKVR